ncbi:MAG: transcription termination/antitermination protein NusG [Candidatus Omnitrophica bacterium]|nr:transcription termination/antitermination protein NusG [Candidatus Omnitrophota bacterium]
MAKKWYVIHTQTGFEEKVKRNLERQLEEHPEHKEFIAQVLVPTEQIAEVKSGKKRISQRKFFPGYILVEMDLNDKTWYFIKNTSGITGFVGSKSVPLPLQENEIKNILTQSESSKEKPIPKVIFEKGEAIRVKEGPFTNFNGTVEETNLEKGKVKVTISIFGRSTPVELETWQIEKV